LSSETIAITLISSLLSGLIGAVTSFWFFYKLERKKLKVDLARRILGYRFDTGSENFSCAINEIVAIFSDSKEVLQCLDRFHYAVRSGNATIELGHLLKSLCESADLTNPMLDDQTFRRVYAGVADDHN